MLHFPKVARRLNLWHPASRCYAPSWRQHGVSSAKWTQLDRSQPLTRKSGRTPCCALERTNSIIIPGQRNWLALNHRFNPHADPQDYPARSIVCPRATIYSPCTFIWRNSCRMLCSQNHQQKPAEITATR